MTIKTTSKTRLITLSGLLIGTLAAPAAFAEDYYVDQRHPSASDSNPGTADRPWATLKRATRESLQPGDNVLVQPGVYDASGGSWNQPAISSPNSGTASKPITFRSVKKHGAVLDAKGDDGAIGANNDYIVVDGFELINAGEIGVVLFGESGNKVTGAVVQNMKIHGIHGGAGNNVDGIRVERTSGALIRNNLIYDIKNEWGSTNAAGVKIYYSDRVVVENNEIYDTVAGIKDKEEGVENHIRRNYIHDCGAGMELMNQNSTTTAGYYFYQNVVANCGSGFASHTNGTAVMRKVYIYNNVFYGYNGFGVQGTEHGSDRRIWNNIFYRSGDATADVSARQDPPKEFTLINYNLYYQEPKNVVGLYSSDKWFRNLAAWQGSGFGFDGNSIVADPQFVKAGSGDFRLAEGSPARGAGRVDGAASGASVNLGPYITGKEVIGISSAASGAAPKAPSGVKVQ